MSTSGISSSVPGFDVLFPNGEPTQTTSPSSATYATVPSTSSSPSTSTSTSSSDSASSSTTGLNQYQQALVTLNDWQAQILGASIEGDLSGATSALYSSAGLSATAFANLASELQNIQSAGTTGSSGSVDSSA